MPGLSAGRSYQGENRACISLLYEKDAVEYIYQLVKKTKHERSRYNLSSNDVISELKLAAMVQEAMGIESNIAAFSWTAMEDVFCQAGISSRNTGFTHSEIWRKI